MTISTEYSNYKKIGNVLLPYIITQNVGEQQFSMNMGEIKINEGVTDDDFKEKN
jgi:hypothetical protein